MSRFLRNDASIKDVVAYIGTLSISNDTIAALPESSKETTQIITTQKETVSEETVTTSVAGGK
jgi:hypothetical protein